MKEKIKEFSKSYLIGFILGILFAGTISVIAATYFPSNQTTYDNSGSGMTSTNVQDALDELYNVCKPPAGEQIIEDGQLEQAPYECRYFFTGVDPNNYITFNNEKASWRIISAECDGTIKIMNTNSVGDRQYDTGNIPSSSWAGANLNIYLNNTYYNSLSATAQSQIVSHNWNVGSLTNANGEAHSASLESIINEEKVITWNGKVGLVSASEFVRTSSATAARFADNWIGKVVYNGDSEHIAWTLSPVKVSKGSLVNEVIGDYAFNNNNGQLAYDDAGNSRNAYPVVYLSSDINITGGTGTKSDPYTIK